MNLDAAANLARELMDQHGLSGWRFKLSRSKGIFGTCYPRRQVITLSGPLTEINSEGHVRDVILHEIAHALTPGHQHDATWKAKAVELGAKPERCYDASVNEPPARYKAVCPGCGRERFANKWHRCSCRRCSGGRFNAKYVLHWEPNQPRPAVDNQQYALFEVTQ